MLKEKPGSRRAQMESSPGGVKDSPGPVSLAPGFLAEGHKLDVAGNLEASVFQGLQGSPVDSFGGGDHGVQRLAADGGQHNLKGVFLGHICGADKRIVPGNSPLGKGPLIAQNTVVLRGKVGGAAHKGNMAVSFFQQGVRQIKGSLFVLKACQTGIQILGNPLQKYRGDPEIQKPVLEKFRILGLAGNNQKPCGILADKIIDDGAFFVREIVGEGYAGRIPLTLQAAGYALENLRMV